MFPGDGAGGLGCVTSVGKGGVMEGVGGGGGVGGDRGKRKKTGKNSMQKIRCKR